MRHKRRLIVYAPAAVLLLASGAHAEATERVYTCIQDDVTRWTMTQPAEHYNAGKMPTWADCQAWRNGDPGPAYEWSYGLTTATTTTLNAETTTTEPATTTVPDTTPPTTQYEANTTTTIADTTTTTTTEQPPSPATTYESPTTTATLSLDTIPLAETTTTISAETLPPDTTLPAVIPNEPVATAKGIGPHLRDGVTPTAARVVVLSTIGSFMIGPSPATRRKNDRARVKDI